MPKVSVITPTFNTPPEVLARTWASLKNQTHTDWEWVVWDDSTDDRVWNQLYGMASDERYRINAHRSHTHSGVIGAVKRRGFMVAEGDILVELDHDDQLTPDALQRIVAEFDRTPFLNFTFSDWCEIFPDGSSGVYPDSWGLGYGCKYWVERLGVWGLSIPTINDDTVQHIVGVPNHVRAWDANFYRAIGGHNPLLDVCDDYELILRTYAKGTWSHIPEVLYFQHRGNTTQTRKNSRIQQLVPQIFKQNVLVK